MYSVVHFIERKLCLKLESYHSETVIHAVIEKYKCFISVGREKRHISIKHLVIMYLYIEKKKNFKTVERQESSIRPLTCFQDQQTMEIE